MNIIKTGAKLVYQHPNGFELAFHDHTLVDTNDECNVVCLFIGLLSLLELANKLRAVGTVIENLAEQAVRELAIDALNEYRTADNQGERLNILRGALVCLTELLHHYLNSTHGQCAWLATAHARRALTLLNQACSELADAGRAA